MERGTYLENKIIQEFQKLCPLNKQIIIDVLRECEFEQEANVFDPQLDAPMKK